MSSLRPQHDTTDRGLKTRNLLPRSPEAGKPRSGVGAARSPVRALFPETAVSPGTSRGRDRALAPRPHPKAPSANVLPAGLGLQRRKLGGRHSVHHRPHQSSPSFGPITCSLPKTLSCARGLSLCPPCGGGLYPPPRPCAQAMGHQRKPAGMWVGGRSCRPQATLLFSCLVRSGTVGHWPLLPRRGPGLGR